MWLGDAAELSPYRTVSVSLGKIAAGVLILSIGVLVLFRGLCRPSDKEVTSRSCEKATSRATAIATSNSTFGDALAPSALELHGVVVSSERTFDVSDIDDAKHFLKMSTAHEEMIDYRKRLKQFAICVAHYNDADEIRRLMIDAHLEINEAYMPIVCGDIQKARSEMAQVAGARSSDAPIVIGYALIAAAQFDRHELIRDLLLLLDSFVDHSQIPVHQYGQMAVREAAQFGSSRALDRLIELGTDPNIEIVAWTGLPLSEAVESNEIECARVLLRHGALPNPPLVDENRHPLALAAEVGSISMIRLLLAYGADPTIVLRRSNTRFVSLVDFANGKGNFEAAKLLKLAIDERVKVGPKR